MKKNIFIVSISSDIGLALASFWLDAGHSVSGTYRTWSEKLLNLQSRGVCLYPLDVASSKSCTELIENLPADYKWDVLTIGVGDQKPVGAFADVNFEDWANSLNSNFVGQMEIIHKLLPMCNQNAPNALVDPLCILFAGGGTNGPVVNYSAYTISKIASIKMVELLDAEIQGVSFTIVGPGWVKTKIHDATLESSREMAGDNYEKTKEMLRGDLCNPMERVVQCCDWLIQQNSLLVSGRNFSVVHDPWDRESIYSIVDDPDIFKLRRHGNELFSRG